MEVQIINLHLYNIITKLQAYFWVIIWQFKYINCKPEKKLGYRISLYNYILMVKKRSNYQRIICRITRIFCLDHHTFLNPESRSLDQVFLVIWSKDQLQNYKDHLNLTVQKWSFDHQTFKDQVWFILFQ